MPPRTPTPLIKVDVTKKAEEQTPVPHNRWHPDIPAVRAAYVVLAAVGMTVAQCWWSIPCSSSCTAGVVMREPSVSLLKQRSAIHRSARCRKESCFMSRCRVPCCPSARLEESDLLQASVALIAMHFTAVLPTQQFARRLWSGLGARSRTMTMHRTSKPST
jgi:Acetamidase/Formamidase family